MLMRKAVGIHVVLAVVLGGPLSAAARDTAFNVQAQLKLNGMPVNGGVDVRAQLFDAASGGAPAGSPIQVQNVGVSAGLLNLRLDFGQVFSERRYLELAFRSPHDPNDVGAFTTLAGRIELTPAPEAIAAQIADTLATPALVAASDPNASTLTVVNDAPSGLALDVQGNLSVGPQGELQVNGETGNLLTQGSVTASGLTTSSDAQVGGSLGVGSDVDVGGGALITGVTFLLSRLDMGGNPIEDIGTLGSDFTASGGLSLADDLTVGINNVVLDATSGDTTLMGDLRVGPTVDFFVNGLTGSATMSGDLSVRGAYFDTGVSPGNAGQFLTSTGTGTLWRDLIVGPLNLNSFAITGIGTGGSSFSGNGSLTVNGNLDVTGSIDNGALVSDPGAATVQINDRLIVGPSVLTVNNVGAHVSLDLSAGPNADQPTFLVDGDTGDVDVEGHVTIVKSLLVGDTAEIDADLTVGGDLELDGALIDSLNSPGATADILVSLSDSVLWSSLEELLIALEVLEVGNLLAHGNSTLGDAVGDKTTVTDRLEIMGGGASAGLPIILDGVTGDIHVPGAYFDSGDSPGVPGQLLSSTGVGTQWINCDCSGGGGGTCLTCDPNGAHIDDDLEVRGVVRVVDAFSGEVVTRFDNTSATFNRPLNAQANFNVINNIVTDTLQVSPPANPSSPVVQVTATADFAPLARFFNFLGTAPALQVLGNAEVAGMLSKGGGAFKIDHPLDPENKYLYHSFVESPDMLNIYNGNVTTDDRGYAEVVLPDWFEALNGDFRYQLTVVDEQDSAAFALVKVVRRIENNVFAIRSSVPRADVSWQVTGIRHDRWANANRIPVETDKDEQSRGKFLHPAAWGAAPQLGVHFQDLHRAPDAE